MLKIFNPNCSCAFFTPSKVNFRLNIMGKDSAYHILKMDMMPTTLQDQIVLVPTKKEDWQKNNSKARLGLQKFLSSLSSSLSIKFNLDFRIKKNIPTQAGLGGSSGNVGGLANAVKFLLAEAKLNQTIDKLALNFGQDVGFFLNPKASLASGYGSKLCKLLDFKTFYLVILKPEFGIKTKEAYASCRVNKNYQWLNLKNTPLKKLLPKMNDFWQESLPFFKELKTIRSALLKFSKIKTILLTGSGSCLLLVFSDALSRDFFFYEQTPHLNFGSFYLADTIKQYHYQFMTLPLL